MSRVCGGATQPEGLGTVIEVVWVCHGVGVRGWPYHFLVRSPNRLFLMLLALLEPPPPLLHLPYSDSRLPAERPRTRTPHAAPSSYRRFSSKTDCHLCSPSSSASLSLPFTSCLRLLRTYLAASAAGYIMLGNQAPTIADFSRRQTCDCSHLLKLDSPPASRRLPEARDP